MMKPIESKFVTETRHIPLNKENIAREKVEKIVKASGLRVSEEQKNQLIKLYLDGVEVTMKVIRSVIDG